jgi:hypothetical protein
MSTATMLARAGGKREVIPAHGRVKKSHERLPVFPAKAGIHCADIWTKFAAGFRR